MDHETIFYAKAGRGSLRSEMAPLPQKKNTLWLLSGCQTAQDHPTCANGHHKFGSRDRNEHLSLSMNGETVDGHTIKLSINSAFHLSNSPPALPGGLHQTAVLAAN
jgi:hypothetical protein